MVLLTDGVTYGDADRCRRIADDAGAAGVGIYPLGIGADWDEDLLDNIGQRSSGMPAEFIRRPDDALDHLQRAVAERGGGRGAQHADDAAAGSLASRPSARSRCCRSSPRRAQERSPTARRR